MAAAKKPAKKKKQSTGRPRGRPSIFTPELLEKMKVAFASGLNQRQVCAMLGLDETTLSRYLDRTPEFRRQIEVLRSRPAAAAKVVMANAIELNDISAAKWWLEHYDPDAKTRQEVKADATVAATVANPFEGLTTDELRRLAGEEHDAG